MILTWKARLQVPMPMRRPSPDPERDGGTTLLSSPVPAVVVEEGVVLVMTLLGLSVVLLWC